MSFIAIPGTSYVARAFVRLDLLYVILIKIIFIDSRL
jgi:hypothetical protein